MVDLKLGRWAAESAVWHATVGQDNESGWIKSGKELGARITATASACLLPLVDCFARLLGGVFVALGAGSRRVVNVVGWEIFKQHTWAKAKDQWTKSWNSLALLSPQVPFFGGAEAYANLAKDLGLVKGVRIERRDEEKDDKSAKGENKEEGTKPAPSPTASSSTSSAKEVDPKSKPAAAAAASAK